MKISRLDFLMVWDFRFWIWRILLLIIFGIRDGVFWRMWIWNFFCIFVFLVIVVNLKWFLFMLLCLWLYIKELVIKLLRVNRVIVFLFIFSFLCNGFLIKMNFIFFGFIFILVLMFRLVEWMLIFFLICIIILVLFWIIMNGFLVFILKGKCFIK